MIWDQLLPREAEWHFNLRNHLKSILNQVSKNFGLLKPARLPANLQNLTEYRVFPIPVVEFVSNVGHNNYSRKQKLKYTFSLYTF